MKWDVETLGPVERKITVEIPIESVTNKFNDLYRNVSKSASIKGFRKGKVPRNILKQFYGTKVAEEVRESLIQDTLVVALQEADLEPTGNFSVEKGEILEGDQYSYAASFEVMALPTGVALSAINAKREETTVTDEECEARLEMHRQNQAELVPVESRGAKEEDIVRIDYEGEINGEPLPGAKGENQSITLGSEGLLPGLSDGLKGLQAGDEKDIDVTIPGTPAVESEEEGESSPGTPDQKAIFHVTVHKVLEREIPAVDDEFAIDIGMKSLEELRNKISADLQEEKKRESARAYREAVLTQLIDANEFVVPESMVEARTKELMRGFFEHLQRQGIDPEQIGGVSEEQMATFGVQAERLCREQALLKGIAAENNIMIGDEDLDKRYKSMAEEYDKDVDEIRNMMVASGAQPQLKVQLQEERVLEFIEQGAKPSAAAPESPQPDGDEMSNVQRDPEKNTDGAETSKEEEA